MTAAKPRPIQFKILLDQSEVDAIERMAARLGVTKTDVARLLLRPAAKATEQEAGAWIAIPMRRAK